MNAYLESVLLFFVPHQVLFLLASKAMDHQQVDAGVDQFSVQTEQGAAILYGW